MPARARIAITAAAVGVAALGALAAAPANASCDTTLTGCTSAGSATAAIAATVDSSLGGTRTITATPVALTSLGNGTLGGPLVVNVVETLAPGANPWGVTVKSSALTATGGTIAASNVKVADSAKLPVLTGGCLSLSLGACSFTSGGSTARGLDTDQKLFAVAGESVNTLYSGTYVYNGDVSLDVPAGTSTGAYTGTLTFTLLQ